jgi:hypothetical protein
MVIKKVDKPRIYLSYKLPKTINTALLFTSFSFEMKFNFDFLKARLISQTKNRILVFVSDNNFVVQVQMTFFLLNYGLALIEQQKRERDECEFQIKYSD